VKPQLLVGKLNHHCKVIKLERMFLRRIFDESLKTPPHAVEFIYEDVFLATIISMISEMDTSVL